MSASQNILVLTYWSYQDALIQTYTLPYLKIIADILPAGSQITLVTLERDITNGTIQNIDGTIHNLQLDLNFFGLKAMWRWLRNISLLRKYIHKKKIDTIHCWCTPAGAIGVILSRITGRKLIIDSYEPHADAMVENGTWGKNSCAYIILRYFEFQLTKRASFLIAAAPYMREYAKERLNWKGNTMFVKPACVDLTCFTPQKQKLPALLQELGLNDKLVAVYAGKFGGIYLDEEVFVLLRQCVEYWGERFSVIILTSHRISEIHQKAIKAGIGLHHLVIRFVPHHQIPEYIGLADFALTPVKPVSTKRACSPIKNGEYWATGLPVLITPNISEDSELIFKNRAGIIWSTFDAAGAEQAVAAMDQLLQENSESRINRIRNLAVQYRSFDRAKEIYQQIYGAV
jgi:hypothetical protein